ncbi:MAG: tryptophan synthase subunit alpha [Candidatus Neomarinimicrobiota bacterium]|nr:tryptophan synthase subunit alpha [Candidatus Neomarinimicrobiota bacterium]
MKKIQSLFSSLGEKVVPFITAGYPQIDSTVELVLTFAEAGADMIEIGIPFSDPLADGPVIQTSNLKALENGITLKKIFQQVREVRESISVPVVLMGYINPIVQWGYDKFLDSCFEAGVDGLIVPDLPFNEAGTFCELAKSRDVSPILLVAPNTSGERIRMISELSGELIYAVSILGITGNDLASRDALSEYLMRVRKHSTVPFIVGFGIKSREDVIWFNKHADGAVVGSEIIDRIAKSADPIETTQAFIRELKGKLWQE